MTKFLKVLTIILLSIFTVIIALFAAYFIITKDARLDENKLIGAGQKVIVCDGEGNEITDASITTQKTSVSLKNLNDHTINAFIASEDRTFFKHNGLNYKRMLKALFKNITSASFKEGASTISQQLIKNTHLSNDKTIRRKLNEIRLTKQLEKRYEKDEILEMYLNTIYFGHNCYGLQSAAQFYFDKKAENLSLNESATIVGLLTSPNNYSPFKNPEKCLKRRNTVLKAMLECKYIDESTYNKTLQEPVNAVKTTKETGYANYLSAVFDELEDTKVDYYTLTDGCTIKTYLDAPTQKFIENIDYSCDNAVIVTDNASGGVKAYKSTINGAKRQPGSTIKPLFVYAPAINEKLLGPHTKILDEKIDYNGYSPENFDKKYHGYVSVSDSIKYSYNVPAVKTLNSLTIKTCEKYLSAMDLQLENEEKNLSLALGGMKHGLSIQELVDKYSIFPNRGFYRPSRFIKEITDKNGKVLYKNEFALNNVFSEGTCSLINDILIQTTKNGTAKKLKNFGFDLASKTGTCGNSAGNTDAYTVSYTSDSCFAVWLGNRDNSRTQITGGTDACKVMKCILESYYSEKIPEKLDTTGGTVEITIDREEYSANNKIIIADPVCPKLNAMNIRVLKGNEPKQKSDKFSNPSITTPKILVKNGTVNIELCHAKYYSFLVNRTNSGKKELIYDGKWQKTIVDTPKNGDYVYSVTPYYSDGKNKYMGKEIVLSAINIGAQSGTPQIEIPDIVNKDWFNR